MKGKNMSTKELLAKCEKDSSERRKIFKDLCKHVSQGLSMESFEPLSNTTIASYLKTYPEDFVQEDLDAAHRQGRTWWEVTGKRQASGDCLGNSRSWYYNMANRYGWREKVDIEASHKGEVSVTIVSYASKKPPQPSLESDVP